ncbi:MAG TPA: replication-relaxation family protein [Conexibacter sp.]|nr:replication-relaxation family protein [Conexibacter sp.]
MIDGDLARKLGDAGVDLGVMGIQWGRRPERLPACSVTDRDLRLLRFVHDFGYVSTSTLAAMFWGRYGSAVRERLKLLHDIGLLDKLRPRVGRTTGAPEWVYRLTLLGWRVLRDRGEPADGEAFRPAKLTSIAYVERDVQVAALMAQIAVRSAEFVGRTGPLIDAAPFELLGPRSGTIDPRRERRAPDASPASTLAGNRTAVMFEFDRTRRPSKQVERLQRYDWFLTVGWRESRYARLDIEPAGLVVCAVDASVNGLLRVADREMTACIHGNR